MQNTGLTEEIKVIAERIREMREIIGFTTQEMAEKTNLTAETYSRYESGEVDLPFTFIHKCSLAFGIGITDILEGHSAHLSSYTVTRRGQGTRTAKEDGIEISNLAPLFRTSRYILPHMPARNLTLFCAELSRSE